MPPQLRSGIGATYIANHWAWVATWMFLWPSKHYSILNQHVHIICIIKMGDMRWNRQKRYNQLSGSSLRVILLSILKVEMETIWHSYLKSFRFMLYFILHMHFVDTGESVRNARGKQFSGLKNVFSLQNTKQTNNDVLKANFKDCSPRRASWPKTSRAVEGKCALKDYFLLYLCFIWQLTTMIIWRGKAHFTGWFWTEDAIFSLHLYELIGQHSILPSQPLVSLIIFWFCISLFGQ